MPSGVEQRALAGKLGCSLRGDRRPDGDTHLRTFNGPRYDIQAVGELTLALDPSDGAEVQARTRQWLNRVVERGYVYKPHRCPKTSVGTDLSATAVPAPWLPYYLKVPEEAAPG